MNFYFLFGSSLLLINLNMISGFFKNYNYSYSNLIAKQNIKQKSIQNIKNTFKMDHTREFYTNENDLLFFQNLKNKILSGLNNSKKKVHSFLKLTRYQNIYPTFLLCFTGGYLVQPSFSFLLTNSHFLFATLNTILIMLNSMVLNDLFDIETDKINHPERPLITGEISILEAKIFSLFLFSLSEFINQKFLFSPLQTIIHLANLQIFLYTPILKRLPFIKNISCAFLVSFSLYIAGFSVSKNEIQNNFLFNIDSNPLLFIASLFLFLGSFQNELLLDIKDRKGDRESGIHTIPTIIGKTKSLKLAKVITYGNILLNTQFLVNTINLKCGIYFYLLCTPLINGLQQIKKKNYDNQVIRKIVKDTNGPLFTIFLFFMIIKTLKR